MHRVKHMITKIHSLKVVFINVESKWVLLH